MPKKNQTLDAIGPRGEQAGGAAPEGPGPGRGGDHGPEERAQPEGRPRRQALLGGEGRSREAA